MKKKYAVPVLVALALTLSACGSSAESTTAAGGNEPATSASSTSGADEPLTRKDTEEEKNDTPLTREDATEKETESGSQQGQKQKAPSIADALDSNTIWANQDEEIKKELVEEAKKEGAEITFGADGTTKVVGKDGTVSIQNADGSWSFQNDDGSMSQFGGDWPENEFTKLVPKPPFVLMAADTSDTEFNVLFSGAEAGAIRDYAMKVKDSGFLQNASVMDQDLQGNVVYTFTASNGKGYEVNVFFSSGTGGMTIKKEQ